MGLSEILFALLPLGISIFLLTYFIRLVHAVEKIADTAAAVARLSEKDATERAIFQVTQRKLDAKKKNE